MASATQDQANNDALAIATRGNELFGLDIYKRTSENITGDRIQELMNEMHHDQPTGGTKLTYGDKEAQYLHFWPGKSQAPLIVYVHGGSWQVGTCLDSVGSAKVTHLTGLGYAFATINFTLVHEVTVQQQVQEIAQSLKFIVSKSETLDFDSNRIILMGHSSGAHVVSLLGTDEEYLKAEGLSFDTIKGVIAIDGSNYNALAELIDNPGGIADNMLAGLGNDVDQLRTMSPIYHTRGPNAGAFLFLHVQRHGDTRQAIEMCVALDATGTPSSLHVFEGEFFEGHVRILLRLGHLDYPATLVMDRWLEECVPVQRIR